MTPILQFSIHTAKPNETLPSTFRYQDLFLFIYTFERFRTFLCFRRLFVAETPFVSIFASKLKYCKA